MTGAGTAGPAGPGETGSGTRPRPDRRFHARPRARPRRGVPTPDPDRPDGYADLRSYAPIGDTRTVALVALDGRIDWWPIPDLDSCPTFAAILDARNGGRLELAPAEPARTARRYLPGTNVLETTHVTASGTVRVVDALNLGGAGRLPWTELARRVEGVAGRVPMRFAIAPGTCLNSASPWAHDTVHGTVLRVHDVTLAVRLLGEVETEVTDQAVHGTFRTAPGSRHLVGVTAAQSEPLHLSTPREVDARLDRTVAAWQQWSGQFRAPGPWADDVARSALLLKLLLHAPSGVDRRRGDDVTAGEPWTGAAGTGTTASPGSATPPTP